MTSPLPLRFAIVGCGHLGSIHARLLAKQPNTTITYVVDPDEAKTQALAVELGTSWLPSLDNIPAEALDAVIIASPTSLHHNHAMLALERGWHCFIEKPVAATVVDATALLRRASTSNVVIQVGHVERFNPAILALRKYAIEPLFIEAHRLASFKPRAIDVSVVHDLMIHDIDLLLWLTGSAVSSIEATGVSVLTSSPDICNARITFANGCVANLTASRISARPMRKLRIFQQSNYASVDLGEGSIELYRLIEAASLDPAHQTSLGSVSTQFGDRMIVVDKPTVEPVNAIAEEQRCFIDSIRNGSTTAVPLHDGVEAVRIAAQIEQIILPSGL